MIRILAAALAAASLAGCSLLSSPDPVQLYRFGDNDPPREVAGAPRTTLVLSEVDFPIAASGDRILTVAGGEVAYLAGGRWVGPAQQLFVDSLKAAFLRDARRVAVIDRREAPRASEALDLEVTAFEARYRNGPEAAPVVVVAGRARIVRPDRTVRAERTFMVETPAADNRMGAVVSAFDQAVREVNAEVVAWADGAAG